MREWYRRPGNAQAQRESQKASRERRLEDVRAYDRARGYRPSEPEKVQARRAVKYALEAGTLTRLPCATCGAPKTDAHHEDYARPLEVLWLCRAHHMAIHRTIAA